MASGADTHPEIDHVLIAVDDLAEAAHALRTTYGLTSVEGGRHPDWGTANSIVPLGDAYLELITVVDELQASRSVFGCWVRDANPIPGFLGWAARIEDLDEVVRRHRLVPTEGSRARPDGQILRWRIAGLEQAALEPCLPFFIEWAPDTALPGRAPVTHAAGPLRITELRVKGAADQLDNWLGPNELPIVVSPGAPATAAVVLKRPAGKDIILDAAELLTHVRTE